MTKEKLAPNDIVSGADALQAINAILGACKDYQRVRQEEETKRAGIQAQKEVVLENLRSQKAVILHYLDRAFDERRQNFESFFNSLDRTLEMGDVAQTSAVLESIVSLAKTSPFKDVKEEIRTFLTNPKAELELEF